MKKLSLILLALCVFGFADAAEFTAATITMTFNNKTEQNDIPMSGMPVVMMTDDGNSSIMIDEFTASTSGSVTRVEGVATVYKESYTGSKQWMSHDFDNQGNGLWYVHAGFELVSSDLEVGETYIFEFYLRGTDFSGNYFFMNNNGQNYKLKFIVKEGGVEKIAFQECSVYTDYVSSDGVSHGKTFSSSYDFEKGTYYLGEVQNLTLRDFNVYLQRADGVHIQDVLLQYSVRSYDSDKNNWNGFSYTEQYDLEDKYHKQFKNTNLWTDVAAGLSLGSTYCLDLMFQVVDTNGNYYFMQAPNGEYVFTIEFTPVSGGSGPGPDDNPYDVNKDGSVNITDIVKIINYIATH